MSVFDIVITVVISVAFVAVVGALIYRRVKGKGGGCGCGCEGCPHACRRKGERNAEEK